MSCSVQFWLFGLASLISGGVITWLFMRNKIERLIGELSGKSDKILSLENDYAGLRASSQEQILALKEEKQSLINIGHDEELNKKYEKLIIEYNNLKSQFHQIERKRTSETVLPVSTNPSHENSKKEDILNREIIRLEKKLKKLKKSNKTSEKRIEELQNKIERLKLKLKKKKSSNSIEKRVEIIKSLRTKKLQDWLSTDDAYKVHKKVSTHKLKNKSKNI